MEAGKIKVRTTLTQGVPLSLLVALLLVTVAGCAPPPTPPPAPMPAPPPTEAPPAKEEGEIRRVIEVKAEGLIAHYYRQSFWGEEEFSSYFANQARFESDFKDDFEPGLTRDNVSASDYSLSFDSATRSTVIRCDIHDAIRSEGEGKYRARFGWLLVPLGLDFIDDNFKEFTSGLSWQGFVEGVPTTVTVELPAIDSFVYEAWGPAYCGHCHAHAWWSE